MKKILFVVILLIQGFYIMAQTPTPTMTATPLPISWQQLNSYSGGTDARSRVGGCYYNNNLWIVGGINTQAGGYVDYVSTNSGLTWTAVTNNLQPLTNEALLSYNGYMYVIGGESGGNNLHGPGNNLADSPYVYQSIDGANWMTVTAGAPFYGSIASTGIVFNNKMWIIAGSNDFCFSCGGDGPAPGSCNTGSWWSTDGLDWNLATGNAQFEPRAEAVGLVYNNQMWIMGGTDGTIYYDDVWNSNDGITWNMVTGTSQTGMGDAFLGFVINNIMYVYVENYSSLPAKLWSSTDGITWTQYAACPLVPPNRREATGIFTGTNFVMAGGYRNVAKVDEVWNLGPAFGCVATPTPGFYIGSVFNIQITCTPSGSIFLGVPINSVDGAEFGYAVATPVWNSHTTGAYNWTSATNINFSYHFMTASASNNPFYTQLIDNCATNANPVYYGWINSATVTPTPGPTPPPSWQSSLSVGTEIRGYYNNVSQVVINHNWGTFKYNASGYDDNGLYFIECTKGYNTTTFTALNASQTPEITDIEYRLKK